jgi:hypothetical protein
MRNKSFAAIAIAILLTIAAYWYGSPFLAVRQLQQAAQEGDAETFNAHVDYPKLRDSLKFQLSALIAQKMGTPPDSGNPLAALGNLIGQRLVDQLVEAMVRPETVMMALNSGRLGKAAPAAPSSSAAPASGAGMAPSPASPEPERKARWVIDRQGLNRMTAYAIDPARPEEPNTDRLGLVFERSGFSGWKLTDIRMPAAAFGKP